MDNYNEVNVINIPDNNGNEIPFEVVKVIAFEGKNYAVMHPLAKFPGLEEDSCAIFEVVEEENENEVTLIPETDDDILDSVYALYVEWATNVEENQCNGSCAGCHGCPSGDVE